MSHPEITDRRGRPEIAGKSVVGMGDRDEQAILSANADEDRNDISDALVQLEHKAAMIENSIAAILAYDTKGIWPTATRLGFAYAAPRTLPNCRAASSRK